MFVGCRLFVTPLVCVSVAVCAYSPTSTADGSSTEDARRAEIVTTETSPQFAKDYAEIDEFYCSIWNLGKGGMDVDLEPQKAERAHEYLKRLLAAHPVRRNYSPPSDSVHLLDDYSISFGRKAGDEDTVFILRFYDGSHMEIGYFPADEPDNYSIGRTVVPRGLAEAENYAVLADCLADAEPHLAGECRRKANAIWGSALGPYVLLLVILVAIIIVPVVLFLGSRNPKTKSTDACEVERNLSCGSQDAGCATNEPPDK